MLQASTDLNDSYQPNTRFAMDRLAFGVPENDLEPISAPPHTLFEDGESYSILFNMYGVPASKIKIGMDHGKRRLTVFAERDEKNFTDQFMWVFAIPKSANLDSLETYYKKGVVQFKFAKYHIEFASVV